MDFNYEKDLKEWENVLETLKYDIAKYEALKEAYEEQSQDIINTTDFKELYGANNQKVRDNHVKKILSDEASELKLLELSISQNKRRINFLKEKVRIDGIKLVLDNETM